ncbi:MAG TPA: glycosyltransferase family A protein [Tepidisphaeraceae bacterium]
MKRVPVSVVIPTYNSASFVVEAIESVLAQTVAPAEIIVVDDGSTDNTAAVLEPYANRIRYIFQENTGVSAARNRGIEAANGDFIAFLDADDIWHPQKLEYQMDVFHRIPALGLLGTSGFDVPAKSLPSYDRIPDNAFTFINWRQLAVKNHLFASSVVVRSSILSIAGEFDTRMQGPEDRDLWLRIAEISTVVNLGLPLTGYRVVPGSVSQQPQRCEQGMYRILQKLEQRQAFRGNPLLRRKARSYILHSCAYLYGAADLQSEALKRAIKSIVTYPLPYRLREVDTLLERPKRLAVILLRMLKLKPLDPNTLALKKRLAEQAAHAHDLLNGDFNHHAHPSA